MMIDSLRGVPLLEKECDRFRHWQDLERLWLTIPEDDRPVDLFLIVGDNGSGYDPTDEENKFYASKFAKKFGIKCIGLASYASGESAKNVEVERPWSQHKKLLVGQRFGLSFLGGERREPTKEELKPFFADAAREMKQIWEANVNVAETSEERRGPRVDYVEPLAEDDIKKALQIRSFLMSKSKKAVYAPENKKMREDAIDMSKNSVQTLNGFFYFGPDCVRILIIGKKCLGRRGILLKLRWMVV